MHALELCAAIFFITAHEHQTGVVRTHAFYRLNAPAPPRAVYQTEMVSTTCVW
jgi:hypothetical protein